MINNLEAYKVFYYVAKCGSVTKDGRGTCQFHSRRSVRPSSSWKIPWMPPVPPGGQGSTADQ